jgi:hypothetical protein
MWEEVYWVMYVFIKGRHVYLVPDESTESAWKSLAKRQSMSVERCKKEYELKSEMNWNSNILKI